VSTTQFPADVDARSDDTVAWMNLEDGLATKIGFAAQDAAARPSGRGH